MFQALYAHHQEAELYWCSIQSDNTRCCINTIQPPDDEHIMFETCRGS